MEPYIGISTLPNVPYHGRILLSDRFSLPLRHRLTECISTYRKFEFIGNGPLLYIAAWEGDEKQMWYEYASNNFVALFGCHPHELAKVFRKNVISRHVYASSEQSQLLAKNIISRGEIDNSWEKLREEGKKAGTTEAVYEISCSHGENRWLKDQAIIEAYAEDKICLSLGFLTILSKEMEAEEKLKKHHDLLENLVQERTAELRSLNNQLQQEIEERKSAQIMLRQSNYQLQQNLDEFVRAMSFTLEQRDPYTAGHQRRTTELALAIAGELGLSSHLQHGLQMAGLIHDMGKISVPAEILCKPGILNDAEMQLVKRHPQVAYDILHQIDFPWPVDRIVLEHHEKIDGTGYPQGLSGNEILLESRILCVSDVVETMETHRPYRPGLGLTAALDEISKNRGTLYDPQVVDACLRLFSESRFQFST